MSRKIRQVVTRFPNLECGFLAGLLNFCEQVRRHLGITTGKLGWEFISTATKVEDPDGDPEVIHFNVGQGRLDQHGKPENKSLCQLCSLDLVREDYDFLKGRPWLREIFELVRANDIRGERISRHPFNLRELMTALSYNYKDNPQLVLDWLSLAFYGVFECCQAGLPIEKVFNPQEMVKGVALNSPQQLEWFETLISEAIATVKQHWSWAQSAVKRAVAKSRCKLVQAPTVGDIKVIEVFCDSFKTGAAGRQAGYQIVIQWNKDGHCQIHGGHLQEKNDDGLVVKKWAQLGEVARALRLLEAKFRGRKIKDGQDWTKNGVIYFAEDETPIPWYLPEFGTSLYNGTMSSENIPPTVIGRSKVFETVCQALSKCQAIVQVGNSQREIVSQKEMAGAL